MIDIEKEAVYPIADMTRFFPGARKGKQTHVSRIVRMIVKGAVLPDGTRLRLEALRLGNQWLTTVRCVREFGERLAAAEIEAEQVTPKPRSTSTRKREISRAAKVLDEIGQDCPV